MKAYHTNYYPHPHQDRDSRPQSNMGLYSQSYLPHHAPFDPFWDQEAWPSLPNSPNTYHWNTYNNKLPTPTFIPFEKFMSLTFDSVPPHLKTRGLRVLRIPPPYLKQQKHTDDPTYNLGKEMAKLVQIGHHIENWNPIPPSLTKKISLITQNICPPLINKTLQDNYKILGQEFESKIAEITRSHLIHHQGVLTERLGNLARTTLPGSLTVASKILSDRFGRLTPGLQTILEDTATKVGCLFTVPTTVPGPLVTPDPLLTHDVPPRSNPNPNPNPNLNLNPNPNLSLATANNAPPSHPLIPGPSTSTSINPPALPGTLDLLPEVAPTPQKKPRIHSPIKLSSHAL